MLKDGDIALAGGVELTVDGGGGERAESVAAVTRVFAILQALGENSEIGISELSQRLVMSKSTVHRFLQTLKGSVMSRRKRTPTAIV
jgi:IclR family transcriptional regulator, KDG regulon repressor